MKAGHFSAKIPGQLSAEINTSTKRSRESRHQAERAETERSRRAIALPARVVVELRRHRKEQAELRLRLGLGKDERDLAFPTWDGALRSPRPFSKEFAPEAEAAGVGHVTFHGLRHTHITHLLRSGVPVHVVSARAGHANPAVTLEHVRGSMNRL
jgi:integrase